MTCHENFNNVQNCIFYNHIFRIPFWGISECLAVSKAVSPCLCSLYYLFNLIILWKECSTFRVYYTQLARVAFIACCCWPGSSQFPFGRCYNHNILILYLCEISNIFTGVFGFDRKFLDGLIFEFEKQTQLPVDRNLTLVVFHRMLHKW